MEFEITQCRCAVGGIGMRQQQVRAEPDQAANPVRLAIQHRAIQIV